MDASATLQKKSEVNAAPAFNSVKLQKVVSPILVTGFTALALALAGYGGPIEARLLGGW